MTILLYPQGNPGIDGDDGLKGYPGLDGTPVSKQFILFFDKNLDFFQI